MFTLFLLISSVIQTIWAVTNFADVACGRTGRTARIVGGSEATPGEFPWMVSITRRGVHFCGGTLINNKWVLTAAHCLCSGGTTLAPGQIKVLVGGHDLTGEPGSIAPVASVLLHPLYTCSRYLNDIALLELENKIDWSEGVRPACLPPASTESFSDMNAIVAGWGWTSEKGGRSNVLQKVHISVVGNNKCRDWYKSQGKKIKIQDSQMCAGNEKGGKDACWADSGGPLMVKNGDNTMVIGIVSTGIGCARPRLPGLYTRISDYVSWISQTLAR